VILVRKGHKVRLVLPVVLRVRRDQQVKLVHRDHKVIQDLPDLKVHQVLPVVLKVHKVQQDQLDQLAVLKAHKVIQDHKVRRVHKAHLVPVEQLAHKVQQDLLEQVVLKD
jgi:GTPase Era involved in 16S rRNA processing